MADKKQYLDQSGLERLVKYINDALNSKADVGDIPNDVALKSDLVDFITANEAEKYIDTTELLTELSDVVRDDDITDVVRDSDITDIVRNADITDVVRQGALEEALNDIQASLGSVYHFRGSVANLEALQAIQNPEVGDVYNIEDTGMNAGWTGEIWDYFGSITDLTDYLTKEEVDAIAIPTVEAILYGGKRAAVSDLSGIKLMLANDQPSVEIKLIENLSIDEPIVIPSGKKVVFDLGGNKLTGANPVQINGGELTIKNGELKATSGDGVIATNGAKVIIDGTDVVSVRHNGISATESQVVIESGSITSQEAGIAGFKDSVITINDGEITGIDNGGLMGNGSPAGTEHDGTNLTVVMNGGRIVGHIQSAGYLACGVYLPNSGSFTMNNGEIISDGCGICMRGGQVNLNGGRIQATSEHGLTGKVGDSRVIIGSYAVVYDAQSSYPAVDTLELNIASSMTLLGGDGAIGIMESSYEPNIHDNR